MMDIRPIKSEQDYEHALARVDELIDAEPGTHEGDEIWNRISAAGIAYPKYSIANANYH
jgi:antitoxin component HigA of HigAB toxin-antitoxin module